MISATETTLYSAVSAPNLFGTYLDYRTIVISAHHHLMAAMAEPSRILRRISSTVTKGLTAPTKISQVSTLLHRVGLFDSREQRIPSLFFIIG